MDKQLVEQRLDLLDEKMDLLLSHVNEQRLRNQQVEDLLSDVSIVGKDMYDSAVAELDKQAVDIDPAVLSQLSVRLIKNLPVISSMLDTLGSANDLLKDASPIVNEIIIDFTMKLHELDQKGYLDFFKKSFDILDNVVTHFSTDDVEALSDNIVTILETIKVLTQPEIMQAIGNAVQVFNSIEQDNISEYSLMKLMRELRKPEMKQALGFMVAFMKNLSANANITNK